MKVRMLVLAAAAIAPLLAVPAARAQSCTNTCTIVAIPHAPGVHTRLDGTADAVMWPPSEELRTVRIAALNDSGQPCDVTITDVRQDEALATTADGISIDNVENCDNAGGVSTVQLRSTRAPDGNGRAYHILTALEDPACRQTTRDDDVLVVVPREEDDSVARLRPYADDGALTASYVGSQLDCSPGRDDRLSRAY